MTRLSALIRDDIDPLISEWKSFARGFDRHSAIDADATSSHVAGILVGIIRDLEAPDVPRERPDHRMGRLANAPTGWHMAAMRHGAHCAEIGLSSTQVVSEFCAFRDGVMRRWTAEHGSDGAADVADLIRFNRMVDRALAESIAGHNRGSRERQDRFLAILGHDLRNPLSAILMSATFMLESGAVAEPDRSFMERIAASSRRMNQMVNDLITFARTRVTDRVPVAVSDMDLHGTVEDVVSEISVAYPGCVVYAHCAGDLHGRWDSARLEQALENLVGNAVQHGDRGSPIDVTASGDGSEVVLVVHNTGAPIPGDKLPELFNPMGTVRKTRRAGDDHLGIGLFIAHEVVTAHGGRIDVRSTAGEGTTFTVHLPRAARPGPKPLVS